LSIKYSKMASSKRSAGRELNHDNWNDEEEGEDVGEFKKASEDELQRRVRKVAKRRNVGDTENSAPANPFSGFGGFNSNTSSFATSTPALNSSPFGFLAKLPSATASKPLTNGSSQTSTNSKQKSGAHTEYASKVKALNIAVADWIKTHVDDNPLCILTPIFKDYEKYLKEFEDLKKKKQSEEKQTTTASITIESKPKDPEPSASTPSFSFGKPSAPVSTPPSSSSTSNSGSSNSLFSSFSFGATPAPTAASQTTSASSPPKLAATTTENKGISSGFTFGSGASTLGATPSTASTTFSFGLQATSTPAFGAFSSTPVFGGFGGVMQAPKTDAPVAAAEEDEEPPKNEFKAVVEDDSLYSKRCKVFVKAASDFADRGVGMLYIKKVDDKIQMIVRADTNLGNILLNIMLVDGLPCSRTGKNNVMVVCIPTPDAKPPPTSVLLRVKTGEEADELLAKINEFKK
jgi:nuclear pore complex protein Nup50